MQTSDETKQLDISVVLPMLNEEGNIEPLLQEITQVLEKLRLTFEIICVDDGSSDGSAVVLKTLQGKDARVVPVYHRSNFGQSAAQATGFGCARGQVIVTMDADRQNDPADMPRLLEALTDVDCVCGIRQKRHDSWRRKVASRIGNTVRDWLTGDHVQDSGCTLRAIRSACLREIPVFNGMHRFLPTLLRFQGRLVREIPVNHRARVWGYSKYGILSRGIRGLFDCLAVRWWKWRAVPQQRTCQK